MVPIYLLLNGSYLSITYSPESEVSESVLEILQKDDVISGKLVIISGGKSRELIIDSGNLDEKDFDTPST